MSKAPSFTRVAAQVVEATAAAAREAFGKPNVPSPDQRAGSFVTRTFTYQTIAGGAIKTLYTANIPWARVKLLLETAGPVAVSTSQQFLPVLSGRGILLQTGVEREITLAKGSQLYVASPTVNRISVVVEPVPWLEQILGGIVHGFDLLFRKGK